jgi:hypothetical protein
VIAAAQQRQAQLQQRTVTLWLAIDQRRQGFHGARSIVAAQATDPEPVARYAEDQC